MQLSDKKVLIFIVPVVLLLIFPPPNLERQVFTIYEVILISVVLGSIVAILGLLKFKENKTVKKTFLIFPNFLLFSIFLFALFTFFESRNLFNSEIITMNDFPIHHYRAWYSIEYLLPKFKSVLGFSPYFWSGYPTLHFYPPGLYLFCSFLSLFSVSISVSIRIFVALTFLLFTYIPYKFCRSLGHSKIASLMATFWVLMGTVWFGFLELGMISYVLSNILTILFIAVMFSYVDEDGEKVKLVDNRIFLSSLLFSLIILFHFSMALIIGIALIEYLIIHFLIDRNKDRIIRVLFFSILNAIIPVLLISFWAVPAFEVYDQFTIFMFEDRYASLAHDLWVWDTSLYADNLIWGFVVLQIIGIMFSLVRKKKNEIFLFSLNLTILFLVLLTPQIGFKFFSNIFVARFLSFFELLNCVFVTRFFHEAIIFAKKLHPLSIRKLVPFYSVTTVFFVSLIITGSIFANHFGQRSDFVHWEEDVSKVFEWIDVNTSNSSRIIIEDTSFVRTTYRGWGWGWGGVLALLPVKTGKSFIGGYHPHHWYKWSNIATVREGIAFDVPFSEMNDAYFTNNLRIFNIRYLVVWSESGKTYLRSLANSSSNFTFVQKIGRFAIFNYTDAVESYILTNSTTSTYKLVRFDPNKIVIEIKNASKNDYFRFALYNFPNWHAYLNSNKIELNEEDFLSVNIPKKGNFSLEFNWETSLLENICIILSSTTFLVLALLILAIPFLKSKIVKHLKKSVFRRKM